MSERHRIHQMGKIQGCQTDNPLYNRPLTLTGVVCAGQELRGVNKVVVEDLRMHTSILLVAALGVGSPVVSAPYHAAPAYVGSIGPSYTVVTAAPVYSNVRYAPTYAPA